MEALVGHDELRSDEHARCASRSSRSSCSRGKARTRGARRSKRLVAGQPGRSAVPPHLLARAPRRRSKWKEVDRRPDQAYVAADPAAADSNYYFRQVADLACRQRVRQGGRDGGDGRREVSRRTPRCCLLKAQNERKAGQLPAAKASLEQRARRSIPKAPGAKMLLAQISNDLGNTDERGRGGEGGRRGGRERTRSATRSSCSASATPPTRRPRRIEEARGFPEGRHAAAGVRRDQPERQGEVPHSPSSAFALLAPAAADCRRTETCNDAKAARNYLTVITTNMPRGGSVSPEAAKQILGAAPAVLRRSSTARPSSSASKRYVSSKAVKRPASDSDTGRFSFHARQAVSRLSAPQAPPPADAARARAGPPVARDSRTPAPPRSRHRGSR